MSKNLKKETCLNNSQSEPIVEKKSPKILPWILDGSYLSEESVKKREALIKEIRGGGEPGSILWDLNNRTVI